MQRSPRPFLHNKRVLHNNLALVFSSAAPKATLNAFFSHGKCGRTSVTSVFLGKGKEAIRLVAKASACCSSLGFGASVTPRPQHSTRSTRDGVSRPPKQFSLRLGHSGARELKNTVSDRSTQRALWTASQTQAGFGVATPPVVDGLCVGSYPQTPT